MPGVELCPFEHRVDHNAGHAALSTCPPTDRGGDALLDQRLLGLQDHLAADRSCAIPALFGLKTGLVGQRID